MGLPPAPGNMPREGLLGRGLKGVGGEAGVESPEGLGGGQGSRGWLRTRAPQQSCEPCGVGAGVPAHTERRAAPLKRSHRAHGACRLAQTGRARPGVSSLAPALPARILETPADPWTPQTRSPPRGSCQSGPEPSCPAGWLAAAWPLRACVPSSVKGALTCLPAERGEGAAGSPGRHSTDVRASKLTLQT